MTDMLQTGVAWLHQQRKSYLAKTVTYRRGNSEVEIADATRGRTQVNLASEEGVEIASQVDDWIFDPANLVLDGAATLPLIGDEIEETVGSQTFLFRVAKAADGEAWRYTDSTKQAIRVHTGRAAIE